MARVTSMTAEILFLNDSAPHTCDSAQHILLYPSILPSGRNDASADNLPGVFGMPAPFHKTPAVSAAPLSFLISFTDGYSVIRM